MKPWRHAGGAVPGVNFKATTPSRNCTLSQWPSEAEFVTIRVGQVEEPLAPLGIARCRVWNVAGRDHVRMEGINVRVVKNNTSPPGPPPLDRLGDEIEIAGSSPKARKRSVLTSINDLKS